eukprot:GDKI01041499.1.p1 GENE.GDKI01041499.1~~GDKI01041499.1.p1  ORF type:complete len:517 (+),score=140.52 GDKI01041499.1:243-1793(+)
MGNRSSKKKQATQQQAQQRPSSSAAAKRSGTHEAMKDSPWNGAPGVSPKKPASTFNRTNFILENTGKLKDLYDVESKKLGQGTYGSVSKGTNKSTRQVRAIKTISKEKVKNIDRFRQEIAIMKLLDHPNIIKLFETFEDHRNIYLVMELCTGGELFDRIIEKVHFTEKDAARLMKQILSAIFYCHSNNIMHRDLKPENFLFLNKEAQSPIKIIDFGLSCRFAQGQVMTTKAGTPYYVAPQVLAGKYDEACDLWSCGVIMYILLCGYPPFYGETDADVLSKVRVGAYSFNPADWKSVSEEAKDLIRKLLKMNPKERLSAQAALQHPWIVNLAANSQDVPLTHGMFDNLRSFRALNKLKKAALTVIAQHLNETDIENLRQIFQALDKDNSGSLTVAEIREGLNRLGREVPADLQQIIEEVDSDGSGVIDYTEFIAATIDRRQYIQEDVCWAAFRVFDLDGNGKISQDELKHMLGMKDIEDAVGAHTIKALLSEVDTNGDGEIDFDEFLAMMRKKDRGA